MNIKTIRNIMNFVFMLGAVIGLIVYFSHSKETGTYIILCAMVVKFFEAALRMFNVGER
jgi:hypothetical protein